MQLLIKWKSRLQRQRKKGIGTKSFVRGKNTVYIEAKVGISKQAPRKRLRPSGINGAARAAFWPTSKAIQTESIEALILPFSKIIREGPTVYYCDYVTTLVNGQIQRFNVHGLTRENWNGKSVL